jgi:hypothetical protein
MEHLRAEHLAVVIHKRNHDRTVVIEKAAELHVAAGFILKRIAQRKRAIEILIDSGVLLPCGALLCSGSDGTIRRVLAVRRRATEQKAQREEKAADGRARTDHISGYAAAGPFYGSGCRGTVFPVRAD